MPAEISNKLIKQYLEYYSDPQKHRIPGRDPEGYNVADDFLNNIQHAIDNLEQLLRNLKFPEPVNNLEQDVYAEFTVTGHAKVRKLPGQQEDLKVIVGQNSMMLEKGEGGTDVAWDQRKYADQNAIVFTSDLPRAIHHALVKYKPELKEELDNFADKVQEEIAQTEGILSGKTHIKLVAMVLNNGIIPTPLLSSHYHGPRDGLPEKPEDWEKFDVDAFLRNDLCKQYFEEESEMKIRQELEELKKLAMTGRNPFQLVKGNNGKILTENLLLYIFRAASLPELFAPRGKFYDKIKGRRVNFVGHSSNIDVISSYFRHFEENKVVLEKADKSKTRGKEVVIKVNSNFNYLNDPQKIEAVKNLSAKTAREQRKASLDEKIKKPKEGENAIIPVELLRFETDTSGKANYEPHPISVDDILKSPEPALWLANFGQGKSTAAIELTEKLNANGQYVGVLVTARDINKDLLNALGEDPVQNDRTILNLLSRDVVSLPKILRDEYKFVFIIDALDEITDHRKNVLHVVRDTGHLKEYGKIVVTSRFTGLDQYENPGFTTLHLDPQVVTRNIDSYLELRISNQTKREKFKDFLIRQDEAIKTNYLLVYFLADIYNKRPSDLGDLKGTVSEGEILIRGIEIALWDHKLTKGFAKHQKPKPHGGQSKEDTRASMKEHETARKKHLNKWMDLLQRVASYMTVHDKRTITRPEIEEIVSSGWTLAKEVDYRKK